MRGLYYSEVRKRSSVKPAQVLCYSTINLGFGHSQIHDQRHGYEHIHLGQSADGVLLKLVVTVNPAIHALDPAPLVI